MSPRSKSHTTLLTTLALATALLAGCASSPDPDSVVDTFLEGSKTASAGGATNGWIPVKDFRHAHGLYPGRTEENLNSLSKRLAKHDITITCSTTTESKPPSFVENQNAEPLICELTHKRNKLGIMWVVSASPTYGPDNNTVMAMHIG